jgi:hypothetical protein
MAYPKSTRKNSQSTNNLSLGIVGVSRDNEILRKFLPAEGEMAKIEAQQDANARRKILNLPIPKTNFDRVMLGEMAIAWWDQVPTDDFTRSCGNA